MNQGKIWRVVNPTVGVPLFLGAVAVSSFAVHYMLYTHTTWIQGYHEGGKKAKVAMIETVPVASLPVAPTKQ